MWVSAAAIRPVPKYALVAKSMLDTIERELADDSPTGQGHLDRAFARFETTQPHLAETLSNVLAKPLDQTALALGYFLSIAVWLAFERTFGASRLRSVSADALTATDEALHLEEELRRAHGQLFDVDDVVAMQQPNVLSFVHEHVDAAIDSNARRSGRRGERAIDAGDVRAVYRAVVLLILCLSHAVVPVDGASRGNAELMA